MFDNAMSDTLQVLSGVPPLLYILYINDTVNHSHCNLFADDAKWLKVQFQITTNFKKIYQLSVRGANSGILVKKYSAIHFSTKSSQQSNMYTIGECGTVDSGHLAGIARWLYFWT